MDLRRAALLVLAIPLAACAMEPPPPQSPPVPPAEAPPSRFVLEGGKGPSEADNAMLTLAKAEDEIDKLFPHAGKDESRTAKKKAPAGEGKPADKPAKEEGGQALAGGAGDPCATACRALASMTTSADHLCKLAGEGDGRCEDARGRVRGATARVRSVCPACAPAAK